MPLVHIRKLSDGQAFAENVDGPHGINWTNRWDWIASTVANQFHCHADDVSCVETDDGDVIAIHSEPVAYFDDGRNLITEQFLQAAE